MCNSALSPWVFCNYFISITLWDKYSTRYWFERRWSNDKECFIFMCQCCCRNLKISKVSSRCRFTEYRKGTKMSRATFAWPWKSVRNLGSFCRYRKALCFWSLGISLHLELFCFLSLFLLFYAICAPVPAEAVAICFMDQCLARLNQSFSLFPPRKLREITLFSTRVRLANENSRSFVFVR